MAEKWYKTSLFSPYASEVLPMFGVFAFFFAPWDEPDAETRQMVRRALIMCDLLDTLRWHLTSH